MNISLRRRSKHLNSLIKIALICHWFPKLVVRHSDRNERGRPLLTMLCWIRMAIRKTQAKRRSKPRLSLRMSRPLPKLKRALTLAATKRKEMNCWRKGAFSNRQSRMTSFVCHFLRTTGKLVKVDVISKLIIFHCSSRVKLKQLTRTRRILSKPNNWITLDWTRTSLFWLRPLWLPVWSQIKRRICWYQQC